MIKLNHLIKREKIYEGLIHTTSMDTATDMLKKWSGSGGKFKITQTTSKIILTFLDSLDEKEANQLLKLINNLGWFVSGMLIFRSDINWEKFNREIFYQNAIDKRVISIQLEAKYDLEANIHDFDVLFHVASSKNVNKILKTGLVPKAKEKILSHPERIYLTDSEEDSNMIAFQFQRNNPTAKWNLFKIDFKGVRMNNPSIRLFSDPNFKGALYTLSNIPPQFITDMGEYNL